MASPPPILPSIIHTPASFQKPPEPSSPTSSTYSTSSSEDLSDDEEHSPVVMEPSDPDYFTHGDLRSPSREFARERSLRRKPHNRPSSSSVHSPTLVSPGAQPQYPQDDDERPHMTPEERAKERKKTKRAAKAVKRQAIKSQETVKNPRKREDRRREDEVAAVEASMAALNTVDAGTDDTQVSDENSPSRPTVDRQRRRSSNTLTRPAKPRKPSSSSQTGVGGTAASTKPDLNKTLGKSPKIGTETEDPSSMGVAAAKRNSPHFNAKHAAVFTQYNLEEGMYERASDIDAQMAALAKLEAASAASKSAKLARGLEEIDRRARERRQAEALKGVVEAAQERYEGEMLAKFYEKN